MRNSKWEAKFARNEKSARLAYLGGAMTRAERRAYERRGLHRAAPRSGTVERVMTIADMRVSKATTQHDLPSRDKTIEALAALVLGGDFGRTLADEIDDVIESHRHVFAETASETCCDE